MLELASEQHAATTAFYHTIPKAQIEKPKMAVAAVSFGKSKNGQTTGKGMLRVARRGEVGERRFEAVRCTCVVAGGLMRMCRKRRGSTGTRRRTSNYWRGCLYYSQFLDPGFWELGWSPAALWRSLAAPEKRRIRVDPSIYRPHKRPLTPDDWRDALHLAIAS